MDTVGLRWVDSTLWSAVWSIVFYTFYWLLVAWLEWRVGGLRWLLRSAHVACFLYGITCLSWASHRAWSFSQVLRSQPVSLLLQQNWILWLGHILVIIGVILATASCLVLGIWGIYLGDWFGLYTTRRWKTFPYSHLDHPLYIGTTFVFLGTALVAASPAGILLSLLMALMYTIAALFELPQPGEVSMATVQGSRRSIGVQVDHKSATISVPARSIGVQVSDEQLPGEEKEKDS